MPATLSVFAYICSVYFKDQEERIIDIHSAVVPNLGIRAAKEVPR